MSEEQKLERMPQQLDCFSFVKTTFDASDRVVEMSTLTSPDTNRWRTMPSLHGLDSLTVLDLSRSRYLTELHPSVTDLKNIKTLSLVGCTGLVSLPDDIGKLKSLEIVSIALLDADHCYSETHLL